MKNFLKIISHFGITKAINSESIKRTILVNQISFVFLIASFPFMLSLYFSDQIFLSLFVPIFMIAFSAALIFNYYGCFLLSKLILYFSILIGTYSYAAILGPESGIQYVFFCLIVLGFGLFSSNESFYKLSMSLLSLFCFLLLYFTNYSYFYVINLTSAQLQPIYITSIILIFIILLLIMYFSEQFSIHYRHHLKQILLTYRLSEREGEVLVLVLNGSSNKTISNTLFIEEGTVKNHLTSIYRKINVSNRNELMAKLTQ